MIFYNLYIFIPGERPFLCKPEPSFSHYNNCYDRAIKSLFSAWATKSIQFQFGTNFSVPYGSGGKGGTLHYLCTRPQHNIIHCKSEERTKGWDIVFELIFSGDGLINQTYFITKNVGKLVTQYCRW